jgi:hypothetical protein
MTSANDQPKDFIQLAHEGQMKLKDTFASSPEMELLAWLRIAVQREAMVSTLYKPSNVSAQLDTWAREISVPSEVVGEIITAINGVWSQENAHEHFFKAVLFGIYRQDTLSTELQTELEGAYGSWQGKMLAALLTQRSLRRHFAQIAVTVGSYLTDVPEYVRQLEKARFPQICTINADLESTAVSGYRRMRELIEALKDRPEVANTALDVDIDKITFDEQYHESLFRSLATWPPRPPRDSAKPSGAPPGTSAAIPVATTTELRGLVAAAKQHAYRTLTGASREHPIDVDVEAVQNDGLVTYLQQFVEYDTGLDALLSLEGLEPTGTEPTDTGRRRDDDDDDDGGGQMSNQ